VFAKVSGHRGSKTQEEYARAALELALLVRRNGLAQACAFLGSGGHSEGDQDARAEARTQLARDLLATLGVKAIPEGTLEYLLLTRRALEAAEYFKRFAESVLEAERSAAEAPVEGGAAS